MSSWFSRGENPAQLQRELLRASASVAVDLKGLNLQIEQTKKMMMDAIEHGDKPTARSAGRKLLILQSTAEHLSRVDEDITHQAMSMTVVDHSGAMMGLQKRTASSAASAALQTNIEQSEKAEKLLAAAKSVFASKKAEPTEEQVDALIDNARQNIDEQKLAAYRLI